MTCLKVRKGLEYEAAMCERAFLAKPEQELERDEIKPSLLF